MEYSTVSLEEMLSRESEETRNQVKKRTAELIAAELELRELRRLRKLTQARLSKKLKIGQEGVSRIEKRSDLYLSTLRSYVEGVGGELTLMVRFPDQPPVILTGFGDSSSAVKAKSKKKSTHPSAPKKRPGKSSASSKSRRAA
jgi:DNA-binding XRE family transcriptional regulator